ncbi:SDR family oxidoreductase [Bradyrhizobium sp. ORS 111]|uniref:SDR family oxidoreductase n=1 Tax=Bradyrhizobium sp. ORS 111 TaxID=1685958 RepID=UPI00388EA96A
MTDAMMSLAGKRVIVIGGSSGIGFAVAALAQERGAEVVIASSNAANVDAAVARLPGSSGFTLDVRDEAMVSRFFDQVGRFDHLAITAGDWSTTRIAATRDLDLVAARDGMAVRFWGSLAAVKHGSSVIAPDGSITLTSGMLAHRPRQRMPFVTASAAAMEGLARGLAVDLAPVRVNAVCPGLILTEPVKRMPEEMVRGYVQGLPLPRAASPNEAATAYLYLMLNGYVTGQTLAVDGGGLLV